MNKLILKDKLQEIKDIKLSINIYNILCTDKTFYYIFFKNGLIFDFNKLNSYTINKLNNLLLNEHQTNIKLSHEIFL